MYSNFSRDLSTNMIVSYTIQKYSNHTLGKKKWKPIWNYLRRIGIRNGYYISNFEEFGLHILTFIHVQGLKLIILSYKD